MVDQRDVFQAVGGDDCLGGDPVRFKKGLWTMEMMVHKRKGRRFAVMVLDGLFWSLSSSCGSHVGGGEGEGVHRFTLTSLDSLYTVHGSISLRPAFL